jgi:hypothetical protein
MLVDDDARIAAVQALNLLCTEPELGLEDAVQLAAAICATPISLITVLDGKDDGRNRALPYILGT